MIAITEILREKVLRSIRERITFSCPEHLSLTAVGSFLVSADPSAMSDIDIVLIVPRLTRTLFHEISHSVASISPAEWGLSDWSLSVNNTFGPLKFNRDRLIVIHLMIYDRNGHRKHVEDSPFTCLDWELGHTLSGYSLKELYSASPVTLGDLSKSRRGIENYLKDIGNQFISYREYDFEGEDVCREVRKQKICDSRHTMEYAYHIIKYSTLNLFKVLSQSNMHLCDSSLCDFLKTFDAVCEHKALADSAIFFRELHLWKREKGRCPENIQARLIEFLETMKSICEKLENSLPTLVCMRHAETICNDGSFFGQGRDVGIVSRPEKNEMKPYDFIWTGTLLRTIQTGDAFCTPKTRCCTDPGFNEIDYGKAEGMTFSELQKNYPDICDAWTRFEDPCFPDGENSRMVWDRFEQSLKRILPDLISRYPAGRGLLVTHNVPLRLLLCNSLQIPFFESYRISVKHLESLRFRICGDVLIPDFDSEQRLRFRSQISRMMSPGTTGQSDKGVQYGLLWQPGKTTTAMLGAIKAQILKHEPDAPYGNHPVHCTFFVFVAEQKYESAIIEAVHQVLADWSPVEISYMEPAVFYRDVKTGGDTLYWPIEHNGRLHDLQLALAASLNRFRKLESDPGETLFDGDYLESLRRWGFPFVGKHWIAHITAASPCTEEGKTIVKQLLEQKLFFSAEQMDSVSLFRIAGKRHIHLQTFEVGKF